jgi:hypothetical protein
VTSDPTVEFESNPTVVEHAPMGTVLVFGGSLTHAGLAVQTGERTVFVASFSPCETCFGARSMTPSTARSVLEEKKELEQKEMIRRAMHRRKAAAIKARCKPVPAAPAA